MSVRRPERIIAPSNQPDTHIERRHGVKTRRQLTSDQRRSARRTPETVITVGDGSVQLGRHVRIVHLTGAGVTVTVLGDKATVTIP